MRQNEPILRLLLMALALVVIDPAIAGDVAAGRVKAQALCQNCHGLDGVAVLPGAANLSGQKQDYLREQLRAYRAGGRQSPHMSVVAKMLTDADIENLSAWYSSIKVSVDMPS